MFVNYPSPVLWSTPHPEDQSDERVKKETELGELLWDGEVHPIYIPTEEEEKEIHGDES